LYGKELPPLVHAHLCEKNTNYILGLLLEVINVLVPNLCLGYIS